ncbi:hypothetical protein [Caballeronia novacaledonica]|uniref:hypothetical protein n=1 Tax=Caballeronia novacaledonica TaxID=1544861 RepID=UPI0011B1F827|nr:hypothetical protein [Caballeronia novacaledonica]
MDLQSSVTTGVALLGAALGVMNTWNTISQRRVRLRVRPAVAFAVPQGHPSFSIEVLNLSSFAVTVSEVGFTLMDDGQRRGKRITVTDPQVFDGRPWPRRLEAREAVSVYFAIQPVLQHSKSLRKAYARTACGEHIQGDSPVLDEIRKESWQ